MKRHRTIEEAFGKVQRDAEGKKLCLLCGKQLAGRKRRWCSWGCSHEAYLQCSPNSMRVAVRDRDKGVCARCGLDTTKLKEELRDLQVKCGHTAEGYRAYRELVRLTYGRWALRFTLWQMNHKQPVAEGGEIWGLDNVETLCTPCHQAETKRLRGRLAWRGKGRVRGAPVPERLQSTLPPQSEEKKRT